HEPERTVQETTFSTAHAIVRTVAVDDVAVAQQTIDGVDRSLHADVVRVAELDERQHQQAGVDVVAARDARVAAQLVGPAFGFNIAANGVGLAPPARSIPLRHLA